MTAPLYIGGVAFDKSLIVGMVELMSESDPVHNLWIARHLVKNTPGAMDDKHTSLVLTVLQNLKEQR